MGKTPLSILLDSNLLVLEVIGRFDRRLVGRKRLDVFSMDDFDLLEEILAPYSRNLTTPHVISEVSNLADQIVPKPRHREFRIFLESEIIPFLDERWTPAAKLAGTEEFRRLGLADSAVCQLAGDGASVLSVDAELCSMLWGRGVSVANFNHLRDV